MDIADDHVNGVAGAQIRLNDSDAQVFAGLQLIGEFDRHAAATGNNDFAEDSAAFVGGDRVFGDSEAFELALVGHVDQQHIIASRVEIFNQKLLALSSAGEA